MKYAVNAAWRHEEPIDGERMRDYMALVMDTFNTDEHSVETIWYQIDEYTHGSVAVYKSEEDYHAFKEKNKMQRDFALNELKVSLLGESMGPAFAVASDLIVERTELNLPKS